MSTAVEAHGVEKRYGSLVAVDDLTFEAQPGEILGVLGPNGAGKTTAIRVLTTILEPTRGSFAVAGVPHTRPAEIRRRIGVLPESAGYPEHQTGEEYLRYHARLYGRNRADARSVAATLLEELGLGERGGSLISTFSRGMRQRLGIARALVNEPQVVFLDEPTLGLDPAGQRQMLATVRRIASERGATVLLSTHLLVEVEETCSRVMILNRGRVAAEGTVAEVARLAAAPRSGRLRVPPDDAEAALQALAGVGAVTAASVDGRPGTLVVQLAEGDSLNEALRAVVEAGIPVLAAELEGARLSDAFLAMTEGRPDVRIVTVQELRDLWLGGRGLVLTFAFSLLLSVFAYLVATNRGLNFLEHRETVNLLLQAAIAVGALLALLAAADTVSGERERGTLESLLLTPVSRLGLVVGKLLGALSLWVVAFLVAIPYVWFLGRGVGLVGDALLTGAVVGTLLAVFLASLGVLISIFARSNRVSLSLSLLLLLALFVPTQLPSNAQQGWAGDLLLRANPITAGEHYVGTIVTNGHAWTTDASWLISPLLCAAVFAVAALAVGAHYVRLSGGSTG